jgi:excinuclease ABC subunit C
MFDVKSFVASLPNLPGVYRMLNASGEVLYVGKARELKKRVASYFHKAPGAARTEMMVGQVSSVEVTVTRSESEALLLENNLIKTLAPRYNVLFKDDKSYPYIMLTGQPFPQIRFYRGSFDSRNQYFGPFPSAWAVRETIQQLQKAFRLRTCEDSVFKNRSRPCLLHQIKRCSAPCVGLIDSESYCQDVNNAKLFLQGKENEVLDLLTVRMQTAAAQLEYEKAAAFRDQVQTLHRILTKQFVAAGNSRDADVTSVCIENGSACVNLVMIRGGRHLGDKSFFPHNAEGVEPAAVLEAFITQHYSDNVLPPLIVTNEIEDADALARLLSEQAARPVQVVTRPSGDRRTWLEMALQNARLALQQRSAQQAAQGTRLAALQQALDLPSAAQRIECFDISHTMGEATVASCVAFDRGAMQNSEYRRYNIAGITPGDDYAAMRDVLARRYRKTADGEGAIPDLILIDGGKGQVSVAAEVLADLGLSHICLVGVAKGEARKPGLEELVFPRRDETLRLPGDHPGLHLIQQIRDEAHRFAITGHRARRGKTRTHSTLQDIGGIGARRRQKLLTRFGGLKGVIAASIDDLARVEGISRKLAERIYEELH